jgi:hypothetical protein
VILEFGSEGLTVLPIADNDEQYHGLLDALKLAAEIGDFAEIAKRSGRR